MANVEVKLVKADYVKFLEEVASIKAPKRSKLLKVTEMASMFLDDYEEDEKGTTVAELEENVQKVLEAVKDLCDRAIWIYEGKVRMDGKTDEVIEKYLKVCQ